MVFMRGRHLCARDGFTLVEVMVVVLVIGVLIAIGLPMFLGAKVRAEERRTQAELRTGLTAGLTYWTDGGTFTGFDLGCSAVPGECGVAAQEESSVASVGPDAPADSQVSIVLVRGGLVSQARCPPQGGAVFCRDYPHGTMTERPACAGRV